MKWINQLANGWGKKGAVDIAGISGYYTFLDLQLNMARQPVPADAAAQALSELTADLPLTPPPSHAFSSFARKSLGRGPRPHQPFV